MKLINSPDNTDIFVPPIWSSLNDNQDKTPLNVAETLFDALSPVHKRLQSPSQLSRRNYPCTSVIEPSLWSINRRIITCRAEWTATASGVVDSINNNRFTHTHANQSQNRMREVSKAVNTWQLFWGSIWEESRPDGAQQDPSENSQDQTPQMIHEKRQSKLVTSERNLSLTLAKGYGPNARSTTIALKETDEGFCRREQERFLISRMRHANILKLQQKKIQLII